MQLNKKNIILIVVVVVVNIAAFSIFYLGYFKEEVDVLSLQSEDVTSNQQDIIKILPYGTSLDFNLLKDKTPRRSYYEKGKRIVNIKPEDVGVDVRDLIKIPTNQETKP